MPVVRCERAAAGEHLDTKELGRIDNLGHRITGDRTLNRDRGIGWENFSALGQPKVSSRPSTVAGVGGPRQTSGRAAGAACAG